MKFTAPFSDAEPKRHAIRALYQADETECVERLLNSLQISKAQQKNIEKEATRLVEKIRAQNENHGGLDAFLQEFKLSSEEGVALMCLAEALLRVPDPETANQLIQDKLSEHNWRAHLGGSESFFVNASTWGLMLTGKVISMDKADVEDAGHYLGKLLARSSEPVIRAAVKQAMKIMGKQFVLAETIQRGLKTAEVKEKQGYCYSYDMLGEAACTDQHAQQYLHAYQTAIAAIGNKNIRKNTHSEPYSGAGISVKLSALHPRYEYAQAARIVDELLPRLKQLCSKAKSFNIGLTIDAEESERLEPSLSLLQMLCDDPDLDGWNGLGFVVQAYQKRAPAVIDWLAELAIKHQRKIMVRLVKGAYWDTEIKKAQVAGHQGYPVYTRKITTDVAYLVCARKLLDKPAAFYPLFATHNALTVASILNFVGSRRDFEFQCLHGMGEILYRHVVTQYAVNCRIYAPVGAHKDLLSYLVRRLLENGANSSFVNRLVDQHLPIEDIVADPIATLAALEHKPHPSIPLPKNIYATRANSAGLNLNNALELESFFRSARENYGESHGQNNKQQLLAKPLIDGDKNKNSVPAEKPIAAISPATGKAIGTITHATQQEVNRAVENARQCAEGWGKMGGKSRAKLLMATADCYEKNRDLLLSLCILEAGKTLPDAVAEIREAVDFLRYYAQQCEAEFEQPQTLTGPTGELNQCSLHGRGVFVCISPWNFPLAIFTGQVGAALAAGNSVIAKPAEQTPIIAYHAVQLMYECGIPKDVLQLVPGDGINVGSALVNHTQIDGVAFTGSTETAKLIQRSLANKPGAIIPFIAETGGINAMIVDSTALPEQVVSDVIQSAFQSAGQRCSALRVLYLQEDIAEQMIAMLIGAMRELKVGDPAEMSTDIGPIIDRQAQKSLIKHIAAHEKQGNRVIRGAPIESRAGYYLSPALIEIEGIGQLQKEAFGPILHVCRFAAAEIERVVDDINSTGYGLTFAIHSRIKSTVKRIVSRIKVGNVYVNRNTIGAVVGVQPFGGEGLSGTGPKAGGPHYLHRFAVERAISTDTTATGGNTTLLSLT